MENEADKRPSGLVLERALGPGWLSVVERVGGSMVDAWDSDDERTGKASSHMIVLPWDDGDEEDKDILSGENSLREMTVNRGALEEGLIIRELVE